MQKPKNLIKVFITVTCIAIAVWHFLFPNVKIDTITVSLLAVAIIPWLASLFKSISLPGGLKVEFQELKRVELEARKADIIHGTAPNEVEMQSLHQDYPFIAIAESNPRLALTGLRIEIQKSLRKIYGNKDIASEETAIYPLLLTLRDKNFITDEEVVTINDILETLNQVSQVAESDPRIVDWVITNGPRIIYGLESKIHSRGGKFSHDDPESKKHWIDVSYENGHWVTNYEWSQHINKHLELWREEIIKIQKTIEAKLSDKDQRELFIKSQITWEKQIELESQFISSIEDFRFKVGREGQMIMQTTFMEKFRDRALELEEMLKLLD